MSTDILEDADKLRNNASRKQLISYHIGDILRTIREEISNAHNAGVHSITYNLPITFSIPHMTNADAQRTVWGSILDELIKKNYRVRISYEKTRCSLFITWISKEDEHQLNHFNRLIIDSSKNDKAIHI